MNECHSLQLDRKEQSYYIKIIDIVVSGGSNVKTFLFIECEQIVKIATAVNYDHLEFSMLIFALEFLWNTSGYYLSI